ncbi:condensation domain-containing protein [Antribacter gilvus]|uniref:condensation domain-containing protein n=1 Tax=Antribacter gilvus TaxID=2304675 RepID=UPI000F798033|nr:condensation domain-containing protein [Antribacter gilvus]
MPLSDFSADSVPLVHSDEPARPTRTQHEVLVGEQLTGPRSAQWAVPLEVTVEGRVLPGVLQRALDQMVVRHPVLRTVLVDRETVVRPPAATVPLTVHDLGALPPEAAAARRGDLLRAEARAPLPAGSGPLLRALLLREVGDRNTLLVHVHHAAFDGLSTGPFLRDLAAVYAALVGRAALPPAPRITFDDAARWLADDDDRNAATREAYWAERLAGVPRDQQVPGGQAAAAGAGRWDGDLVERALAPDELAELRTFVASTGTTPDALVLAASAVRVARETGRTDVVLCAPTSTRGHADVERVIGPMMRSGLARVRLDGDPEFGDLVLRVADETDRDAETGTLPWGDLLRLAGLDLPAGAPRVPFLTVSMQRGVPPVTAGNVTWSFVRELASGGAKADLTLFWDQDNPARPRVAAEFALERFTADDAARFLDEVVGVALAGAAAPTARVSRLGRTAAATRRAAA